MTQKHYNWMTPDEAARELELDCIAWKVCNKGLTTIKLIAVFDSCIEYEQLGRDGGQFLARDIGHKCICRAIVPEVPSGLD